MRQPTVDAAMDAVTGGRTPSMGAGTLLLDFVNTRSIVGSLEHLADGATTKQWFVHAGLIADDVHVAESDAVAARELRGALVSVLKSHVDADGPEEARAAVRTLEVAGERHPLALRLGSGGVDLVSTQSGFAGGVGAILAAAAVTAFDEREWVRLKACKNPVCYLGFRDDSRNGSALYCCHGCSSQVSMRNFRQRRRA